MENAQLSSDELTIVFSRATLAGSVDRPIEHYGDLYIAHRDHRGDAFREATALDEINSEFDELTGSLSSDQRTLYFDRQSRGGLYEILAATRPAVDQRFGTPTVILLGTSDTSDFEPFITAHGLYFGSTRGNGLASLFLAGGQGRQFAAPQRLTTLETREAPTAYEDPVVSGDGLTIYFSAPPDGAKSTPPKSCRNTAKPMAAASTPSACDMSSSSSSLTLSPEGEHAARIASAIGLEARRVARTAIVISMMSSCRSTGVLKAP